MPEFILGPESTSVNNIDKILGDHWIQKCIVDNAGCVIPGGMFASPCIICKVGALTVLTAEGCWEDYVS